MASLAMADQQAAIPHLSKGEIKDLRSDVDAAFEVQEAQTGYPALEYIDGASAMSLGGLPLDLDIHGDNLLQDQEFASVTFGSGTSELIVEANRPGEPGNDITVELETGAGEAIGVVDNAITVTLDTGTSTPNSIKALIEGDTAAQRLVHCTSGGAGVIAVEPATALEGGVGEGLEVLVKGNDVHVVAKSPNAGLISAQISGMTGAGAGDVVACRVKSNGRMSDTIGLHLTA